MGMMNNPNPYGSPYTQNSGQQMGASGLGLQIPTKSVLPNSLSPFAMDKKAVPGGGMPNMVGSNLSADLFSIWHLSKRNVFGTSLVVLWLRLCASNAGGVGSIPGWGTKIPNAMHAWCSQKIFFFKEFC